MKQTNILRITQTAVLSAVAVVLSIFESFLPSLPIPVLGAKLGLSNIVTMFCANTLGLSSALLVSVIKSIFVLFTRGATAFIMSLFAGVTSTLIMWLLISLKHKPFGFIGIGVAGAFTHNLTQSLVAYFIVGESIVVYIPILILIAIITGSITGLVQSILLPQVTKINFLKLHCKIS